MRQGNSTVIKKNDLQAGLNDTFRIIDSHFRQRGLYSSNSRIAEKLEYLGIVLLLLSLRILANEEVHSPISESGKKA